MAGRPSPGARTFELHRGIVGGDGRSTRVDETDTGGQDQSPNQVLFLAWLRSSACLDAGRAKPLKNEES